MKLKLTLLQIIFILSALLLFSCSGGAVPTLVLSPETAVIGPGMTAELTLDLILTDEEGVPLPDQGRIAGGIRKIFAAEPAAELSDSGFSILSAETGERADGGISAKIIVRASETLLSGAATRLTATWGGLTAESSLRVKKNPDSYIDSDGVISDPAAYDAMINKERRLPADYIPSDLVRVEVPTILVFEEVNHLRRAASEALSAMFAAAADEEGCELLARSGYRAYKTQVSLYEANVREYGEDYARRISARPGTSEHQSGLAMDISSPVVNYQLVQEFGDTAEGLWVADNAHRFGFIIRYPQGKEDVTGYDYEPWHLRWVGESIAAEIYSKGLTLEEYFTE